MHVVIVVHRVLTIHNIRGVIIYAGISTVTWHCVTDKEAVGGFVCFEFELYVSVGEFYRQHSNVESK